MCAEPALKHFEWRLWRPNGAPENVLIRYYTDPNPYSVKMNLRRLIWNTTLVSERKKIEWYPPFWLMRIRVIEISDNWRSVRILLPRTWVSRNAGGSLFGGFQAAVADNLIYNP